MNLTFKIVPKHVFARFSEPGEMHFMQLELAVHRVLAKPFVTPGEAWKLCEFLDSAADETLTANAELLSTASRAVVTYLQASSPLQWHDLVKASPAAAELLECVTAAYA